MSHIFISYSRKDIEFAGKIVDALAKNELKTWIDWKSIPKGEDWEQEIYRGIEEADAFLFLISPDSAKSEMCNKEIAHAIKNNKRVLPIVVRNTDIETILYESAKKEISRRNWIFCRKEQDNFDKAIEEIQTTIHTDYEWVQTHRRLQVKALDWERTNKDNGFLLRGMDLLDAEQDLAKNTSKDPFPTDLQRDYVFNSRQAADRQRRIITGISVVGIITLAALAVFGLVQAGQATKNAESASNNASTAQANLVVAQTSQADAQFANSTAVSANATTESNLILTENELRKARNQALSAQAELISKEAPSASILLALEAIKLNQDAEEPVSNESYQALRDALSNTLGIAVDGNSEAILVMKYSKDGAWFATGGKDGLVRLWDTKDAQLVDAPLLTLNCNQGEVQHLFFSSDGTRLVTIGTDKIICIWDLLASDPSQSVRQMTANLSGLDAVAVSDNGQWITVGNTGANQVLLWDLEQPEDSPFEIRISDQQPSSGPLNLVFNPEASLLLVANDSTIEFWSIQSTGPSRIPGGGIFDPLLGKTYYVWMTGTQGLSNLIHVRQLQFTPDGKRIIGLGFSDNRGYIIFILNTFTFLQNPKYLVIPQNFEPIQLMSISPNGRWLAVGNVNTIWVWDIIQNRNPLRLDEHQAPVNALEFSNDGRWLASASGSVPGDAIVQGDGTVRLWDLSTNNPAAGQIAILTGLDNKILAFDPHSNWLAFRSENRLIRLFDLVTKQFSNDPLGFYSTNATTAYRYRNYFKDDIYWNYLVANPTMNWLVPHLPKGWKSRRDYGRTSVENFIDYASASVGEPDLRDTYLQSDFIAAQPSILTKLAPDVKIYGLRPDRKHLVYGVCDHQDLNCEVFEIDISQESSALAQPFFLVQATGPTISKVIFTSDNHWMILVTSSDYGNGSYLINLNENPLRIDPNKYLFYEHFGSIISDRWLIVNNETGSTFYDLELPEPIQSGKFRLGISALAISPDGRWLVYVELASGDLGILDLHQLDKDSDKSRALLPSSVTQESNLIEFKDRTVRRESFDRWKATYQYEDISFSADSRWLAVAQCLAAECEDANFYTWDLSKVTPESAKIMIPLSLDPHLPWQPFTGVRLFSPDQRWLGLLDNAGNITLVDLSGNSPRKTEFPEYASTQFADFAFSPDSRWCATVDRTGRLVLHDLSNRNSESLIPDRAPQTLASVSFGSDKNNIFLAGGTSSGTVLLWNFNDLLRDSSTLPIILQGGVKVYDEVIFAPDNKWVLAYGSEEPLKAWRVNFEDVLNFACEVAGRNLSPTEWDLYGFTEEYRATCSNSAVQAQTVSTPAP